MKKRDFVGASVKRSLPQVIASLLRPVMTALTLTILLGVSISAQQNTADVVGTVTDASGAVIPGATVTITNSGTNISQHSTTGADGNYIFTLLQVGTYAVKVEAKGFKTFSAPNITLAAGDRARVDAAMQVGDVTQTVEVSGAVAPALQTDSSTLGNLVTSQAVQDIPLNGRNFIKLVQLNPGVTEGSPSSIQAGGRPDDRRITAAFSANGQSETYNNQMVDGMDNNERIIGTIGVRPSVDAIQEVNVSTNLYDASVSRTAGGVVDVITKSGTNDFHGSTYEFIRNAVLNSNPNYRFPTNQLGGLQPVLKNPAFRQNQYGGSIGGPIRKNKTFFFGDFEQLRIAQGKVFTYTVPTLCEHGLAVCPDGKTQLGDFSDAPSISAPGGSSAACTAGPGPLQYGTSACPYVVIPQASITPIGQAFFGMYPLPTSPALTNNFTSNQTYTQNSTTSDVRVDQHFSDKDSFYARYSFNNVATITPGGLPAATITPGIDPNLSSNLTVLPGSNTCFCFPGTAKERQQQIALSYVHVFQPNLLLNLKAGYLKSTISSLTQNFNQPLSTELGFPCNSVSCINSPGNTYSTDLVQISTNYATLGAAPFVPLLQYDNTFQYSAALTWNKGAQSIKIGIAVIRRQATIGQSSNGTGSFAFSGGFTGEQGGDLLEGLSSGPARALTLVSPGFRTWEPSTYLQDDWRARHWLTLNLGIRYDIFTPYTEKRGRIVNWDPATGLLVSPSMPGAQQSTATAMVKTNYLNVAPRFGFAATLKGNTVVRGGFGLSFFPTNYASGAAFKNAPYNFGFTCSPQNELGTNTTCPAPFTSSATVQYGPPPSVGSSQVGQSGGAQLAAGLPAPVLNVNTAVPPANCTFVSNATYAATCPNNPYATSSISEITWPNYPWSYLEQFNVNVQKEFAGNVLTVGYVGELGRHTGSSLNMNSISNYTQTVLPLATQFPWLAKNSIGPNYNMGTSSYNALQTSFQRRFQNGLTVNVGYTWAHALVDGGASCNPNVSPQDLGFGSFPKTAPNPCYYDNPKDPANPIIVTALKNQFGVGNSGEDVHDRFTWTVNYQIPFGKSLTGIESAILKGWAVNAAGSWQTGLPFTAGIGQNLTGVANGNPDQICSGRVATPSLLHWFNTGCFEQQQDFVKLGLKHAYGNELSNQLFGPPQRRLDFSVFKDFSVTERIRIQFRTEVFNLFNTPNFGNPSTSISLFDSNGIGTNQTGGGLNALPVGAITSLNTNGNPRQIQFGLKILF